MLKSQRLLLAGLSLLAVTLTGCSSVNNLFSQVNEEINNTLSTDNWTTEDSGGPVTSLNRYTDLINSAHEQMQYLDSDVQYFESDMNAYDGSNEPYFSCNFELYDRESLESDTLNPSGLSTEESSDLVQQATAIFATIDATETLCKKLSRYVTAQDYKTDDFAEGKTDVDELYTNIDAYYSEHDTLLETLDGLYDQYDTWTVDPNDPVSVGIDNMDKDLTAADDLLTLVEDSTSAGTFDKTAEIQADYDVLTANLAAHTGDNAPSIDSTYSSDYKDFYDTLENSFLPTIKRTLRDMQNQDADALSTDYYNVLDYYNAMVDSYNYFLDVTGY